MANPVAVANATSTWDTIKTQTFEKVNWVGRQICWLAGKVADGVMKVVEWVKPFFQTIAKFCVEQAEKLKELIVSNKQASILVAFTVAITAVVSIAGYIFCFGADSKAAATQEA